MTLKYLGVHPEHMFKGAKYEKHLHHTDIIKGKNVNYYEVVEIDETNTEVSISQAKRFNKQITETTKNLELCV